MTIKQLLNNLKSEIITEVICNREPMTDKERLQLLNEIFNETFDEIKNEINKLTE